MESSREERATFPLDPGLQVELMSLIDHSRFILAMKRLREATGCSLVEAKGWVEKHMPVMQRKASKPCPYCGKVLRTDKARQCFDCGMDWHDSNQPIRRVRSTEAR